MEIYVFAEIGAWKSLEELEDNLILPELIEFVGACRRADHRGLKIAAMAQGAETDLDSDDYGFDIVVMDSDGSNHRNITSRSGTDFNPRWSPDGTKIAFVSTRWQGVSTEYRIYVMEVDESWVSGRNYDLEATRVSPTEFRDTAPVWSPDGSKIGFTSLREHGHVNGWNERDVYIMNADGSNEVRIISTLPCLMTSSLCGEEILDWN